MQFSQNETRDFERAFNELPAQSRYQRPSNFEDPILQIIEGKQSGTPLLFCPQLSFRPGEVTIWGGINGHGKSLITGQVALQLIAAGKRSAILSFEMTPERTLLRMIRQYCGHTPQARDVATFLKRVDPWLLLLNHVGSITPAATLGACVVAARDYDCQHVFIDNLMRVVAGTDDYTGQKIFIQNLTDVARALGVHIHIVHHVRKGQTEDDEIGKFSFNGSGDIVNQVDNAILIQRNRKKERELFGCKPSDVPEDDKVGDSVLRIVKQRNGDYEGVVPLWFNADATAFCTSPARRVVWKLEGGK